MKFEHKAVESVDAIKIRVPLHVRIPATGVCYAVNAGDYFVDLGNGKDQGFMESGTFEAFYAPEKPSVPAAESKREAWIVVLVLPGGYVSRSGNENTKRIFDNRIDAERAAKHEEKVMSAVGYKYFAIRAD